MKKVLILSGSPRKGGNSDIVAGAAITYFSIRHAYFFHLITGFLRALCELFAYYCRDHAGECAIKDDMAEVLQKMIEADVIVLASPVYFYSIDAQLKAVIDRTVARWLEVKNKEFYYIATCAEEDKGATLTTLDCFRGYADCVEGAKECGVIYGTGVYEKGKIEGTPAYKNAYEMGRKV